MRDPPISPGKGKKGWVRKYTHLGPIFRRRVLIPIRKLEAEKQVEELGYIRSAVRKEMYQNPNYLWFWGGDA